MTQPDDDPEDRLPDDLAATIDSLDASAMRAVVEYAEARLDDGPHTLEEDIRTSDVKNVVSIDDRGAYALVKKREPATESDGDSAEITSLYLVRHERHLDGETALNWAYLGDVDVSEEIECQKCGALRSPRVDSCPQCGTTRDSAERE